MITSASQIMEFLIPVVWIYFITKIASAAIHRLRRPELIKLAAWTYYWFGAIFSLLLPAFLWEVGFLRFGNIWLLIIWIGVYSISFLIGKIYISRLMEGES